MSKEIARFVTFIAVLVFAGVAFAQLDNGVTDWGSDYLPEDERLYDRTVMVLSGLQCPDFSDVETHQIVKSFDKIFQGLSTDIAWYEGLREKLSTDVVMEDGHTGTIQGPPLLPVRGLAVYLTIIKGDDRMWVTIGPYSTPVSCAK